MPSACNASLLMPLRSQEAAGAPSFDAARNRRQQARAAGLHPDYWYAVEYAAAIPVGHVAETRFWGRSIALYRGSDGTVRAIENRCAHRQVKLSLGEVAGCNLTCPYHGWTYDGGGQLVFIPHELFGHKTPKIRIASFPVRTRYGLIWIFPGDPTRAEATPMPELPELEGPKPWVCVPLDFTWRAHHSLIIENVSDFTHAHLHRKYRPFLNAKLISYARSDRRVELSYDVLVGDGRVSKYFVDRKKVNINRMELCFDYPHQWSSTDSKIKHWCFVLPLDERTTRIFFVFYFDALRIPFTRIAVPRQAMRSLLRLSNWLLIRPLLMQDGAMVEAEQRAYEAKPEAPAIELNPVVIEFQKLIIEKWRRHRSEATGKTEPADEEASLA
jgi:phenylpropionate dioxygenase-like ring-hydroxylating dioxygenase large terminal subunit